MLLFFCLSILLLLGSLLPPKKQNAYLVTSFIVLFILSAFRDVSVGTDTANYEVWFEQFRSDVQYIRYVVEPAWVFLNDAVIFFGGEYRHLIIVASLLILLPLFFVAKKYSYNPMLVISLYYLLYFYFYSFNGTRQLIAVNIVLISIVYLIRKKSLLFVFLVFIATLFHKSALVALPLLFVNQVSNVRVKLTIYVFMAMILGIFGYQYITILVNATGYAKYLQVYESGNILGNLLFLLILNSFFVFILFTIKEVTVEVKVFFAFIILINLIMRVPYGGRLVWYFSIYQILFYPYYLYHLKPLGANLKITSIFIVILFSYIIFIRSFGAGEILPYINVLLS